MRFWMGHTQCVSKSVETEPATLWKDWRRKFRSFPRSVPERRSVASPTALMTLPDSALDKSLLRAVHPKKQLQQRRLEPTVDAEGFEGAMMHLSESGWYWGTLTAAEAKLVLDDALEGTFLLRKSSNPAYLLTLSVRTSLGPTHLRIEYANGKFSFDSVALARPQLRQFKGAVELVQYYALAYQRLASPTEEARPAEEAEENSLQVAPETLQLKLTRPRHKKPGSLQHLCRKVINQHSHSHNDLPLPERLKGFLLEYPFLL
ncbi:suppressor of cytokine signaling 2-like isoform X1 [Sardina pilchardus]|uniref:suppressor of cytokine signaling 2-like isoform X1 n=2 Tax=Sardina pilchardus TaxID=27697 RepID=UPI002E0F348E